MFQGEAWMSMAVLYNVHRRFKSLMPYFKVCRVESWVSWVFNFALGSVIFNLPPLDRATKIFFAFFFATASIFVLNQYFDRQTDKMNKVKSALPIASEQISPRDALIFTFLLIISCFILILITDIFLLPFFILYLGLWTAYSAPSPKLKSVPVIDFIISGIGAGFLPFFIGLSALQQPNVSILFVTLSALPLILFHSGGHIIQAIGDYEADREAQISTFVVKYGKKRGATIAGLMFFSAFISPFTYLFAGLLSIRHLLLFFILIPLSISTLLRFIDLYKKPSSRNVIGLQKEAGKYGILALIIIWIYILITKVANL